MARNWEETFKQLKAEIRSYTGLKMLHFIEEHNEGMPIERHLKPKPELIEAANREKAELAASIIGLTGMVDLESDKEVRFTQPSVVVLQEHLFLGVGNDDYTMAA